MPVIEFEHNTLRIISLLELDITECQKETLYQLKWSNIRGKDDMKNSLRQISSNKEIGLSSMIQDTNILKEN